MTTRRPPVPERAVLRAIMDYLDLQQYRYLRCHPVKPLGIQGAVRFLPVRPSQRGAPDLIIFGPRWVLCLEAKSSVGRKSEAQIAWGWDLEGLGHGYAVVRSLDEAMAKIRRMPE